MKIALIIILYVILSSCKSDAQPINTTKIAQNIQSDSVLWIDVRSLQEYDSGHLPEAIHIPYQEIADKIGQYASSKQQVIKLYCSVGGRSSIAASTLIEMGYFNVSNEGGYEDILVKRKQVKSGN